MSNYAEMLLNSENVITMIAISLTMAGTIITYIAKHVIDDKSMYRESKEISEAVKNVQFVLHADKEKINEKYIDKNVINMMIDNVSELREYYVISKQQARKSFSAALFICFFGILIYLLGIVIYIVFDKDISIISVIGGTVVEVIAGLFFWLYRESTKQLGIYHQRLGSTEKYLTVIQIVKEMPEDKQAEAYNALISSILSDNKEIISHEK